MNSRVLLILGLSSFLISCSDLQNNSPEELHEEAMNIEEKINWVDFETALNLNKTNKKKVFIDIYTDWCGWCKKMDSTTFSEDTIANILNNEFHAVKLDAETTKMISFNGMDFNYNNEYKANELAVSLLGGRMGYPSYVILDEDFKMISQPIQSYLTSDQLLPILDYFGNDIYLERSWQDFFEKAEEDANAS